MGAPRRETDSEEDDYSQIRRGPLNLNGSTKWIVTGVGAAVLSLAGWGVKQDRDQVERRLLATETSIYSAQLAQARLETQLNEIQRSLDKIERSLDRERRPR